MKEKLPQPVHESYLKHRQEVRWKIIAPVVVAAVLCFACSALAYVGTFRYGGDVELWSQISTIYLAIPTIIFLVVIFAMVGGIAFLLTKLLGILPRYTFMAQDLAYKMKAYARRGADAIAKPVITIDALGASLNRIFGKK
ncbi:MAG: hypothetical protein ACM3PS_03980 [Syntrophothermus sp.]